MLGKWDCGYRLTKVEGKQRCQIREHRVSILGRYREVGVQ